MLCSFLLSLALAQAPAGQADQARSVSIAASSTATSSTAPPLIRTTYGERLKVRGLPNGGRISESLYRGAQPSAEGMKRLQNLGITTIVDLRGEDAQTSEWERRQAEVLGIHFVMIPVSGWAAPSNQQVAQFLSLFRNNPKEKVFIHCRLGEDRTGVFVAAYRMAFDRWSAEQAINEMYFFGFNGLWHSPMKSFVRSFPTQLQTESIFADYRSQGEQTVTKCDKSVGAAECAN